MLVFFNAEVQIYILSVAYNTYLWNMIYINIQTFTIRLNRIVHLYFILIYNVDLIRVIIGTYFTIYIGTYSLQYRL